MTTTSLLASLERALLAVGIGLALWCAAVLVEARFTQTLAIPPRATVTQTLPGDSGSAASRAREVTALAPGTWLARLDVPSLELSTTVLEGSDDSILRRGAGHIEDTPLPGAAGNVGIAGHRDTVFRPLRHVRVGDALELTTPDHVYSYRVRKTEIVNPEEVHVLDPTSRGTVTLVTCYPFEFIGHAPMRFIVQAELVEDHARVEEAGRPGRAGTAGR